MPRRKNTPTAGQVSASVDARSWLWGLPDDDPAVEGYKAGVEDGLAAARGLLAADPDATVAAVVKQGRGQP